MSGDSGFASASVPRHLLRGAIGFGSIAAALVLAASFGPVALLLVPAGLFALRGCPTCWLLGLIATVSDGRVGRGCAAERNGDVEESALTRRTSERDGSSQTAPSVPSAAPKAR
ncbi:MAG TPA: hypothetical protein VK756_07300 [Solirubrobacteraceae bacterium]|jgi:hypothetical protein|nr:hypothetical protein [Solirubrobacteraceae bacterium]